MVDTQTSIAGSTGAADEAYCATCGKSFPAGTERCPQDGGQLVAFRATQDPWIGRVLDKRYEIKSVIGEGGMGAVYRGIQLTMHRDVAIKVIKPSVVADRDVAKRFLREARLSSKLVSANVVTVFDSGQTEDGGLYLVMELIEGHTLASVILASGPIPSRRVAAIGRQLCDALETAHQLGVVHRDLKPANVMIVGTALGRDQIKVLDFGLAKSITGDSASKITATHAMLGTPTYMAPEQIDNGAVDARTDLYALGCMLYEMLAGHPPFVANQITALFAMHLGEAPPPLPVDVTPGLASTIMRLLQKDPAARFASAAEVRDVLDAVSPATPLSGVPIVSTPNAAAAMSVLSTRPVIPMAPTQTRRRGLQLAIGLVATLGIGIGAFVIVSGGTPTPMPTPPSPPAPTLQPAAVQAADAAVAEPSPVPPSVVPPVEVAVPAAAAVEVAPKPAPAPATKPTRKKPTRTTTKPAEKPSETKPTTKPEPPPDELPLAPIRR